jgi:hypothetical protein
MRAVAATQPRCDKVTLMLQSRGRQEDDGRGRWWGCHDGLDDVFFISEQLDEYGPHSCQETLLK